MLVVYVLRIINFDQPGVCGLMSVGYKGNNFYSLLYTKNNKCPGTEYGQPLSDPHNRHHSKKQQNITNVVLLGSCVRL